MIDGKPVPGTRLVAAIFSPGHGQREHAGALALVDPALGPDDPDRPCGRSTRAADLRDPWPLARDLFLAARGPELVALDGHGRIEVLASAARGRSGVPAASGTNRVRCSRRQRCPPSAT